MKQLISLPLGANAHATVAVDAGDLKLGVAGKFGDLTVDATVGYPVIKVLDPIKKNFVDKLKALIPGTWDDALIDKAWAEAIALASDAPSTPAISA